MLFSNMVDRFKNTLNSNNGPSRGSRVKSGNWIIIPINYNGFR